MRNSDRYQRNYYMPLNPTYDWVKKEYIDHPPIWCSVDLRDGNQALIEPMNLIEKLEFFKMLVKVGFKEIEVGFPAASDTEYEFMRTLIEKNMIPDDVTVQVLTQAREHIIKKTFEAVKGAPRAVIHLYNSTSVAQREQVFKKSKEEIKKLAIDGAKLLKELADKTEGNFAFEYSPESFTGTEPEYSLEVCNAVLDVWKPTKDNKAIINIPATVELSLPHVWATQVEFMHKNLKYRDSVILSLHPHNDRGTGVALAELGCLAGADRVEGTLFGNGERTGNVDLITVAMNMFTHGVDPKLDFSDIPALREAYERLTGMQVPPREPYAGDLVFTAFSGSHQDAIAKGSAYRVEHPDEKWSVPYIPIDPKDIGRQYEGDVIRINSQSGKGGVNFILNTNYGIDVPKPMQGDLSYAVKEISDHEHAELSAARIHQIFEDRYMNREEIFAISDAHFKQKDGILASVTINHLGHPHIIKATGNGRLDAVNNAIKNYFNISYELSLYEEHALTMGSTSKAMTYVGITMKGVSYWGAGVDDDIIKASINALVSAVNQVPAINESTEKDPRLVEMLNIIQENYTSVTLDQIAEKTGLSKPYVSRYIKEHSGLTFGDNVRKVRMKKAKALIKNTNMKIEKVSEAVGYQNTEHFNRLFKKEYGVTPVQFRNQ